MFGCVILFLCELVYVCVYYCLCLFVQRLSVNHWCSSRKNWGKNCDVQCSVVWYSFCVSLFMCVSVYYCLCLFVQRLSVNHWCSSRKNWGKDCDVQCSVVWFCFCVSLFMFCLVCVCVCVHLCLLPGVFVGLYLSASVYGCLGVIFCLWQPVPCTFFLSYICLESNISSLLSPFSIISFLFITLISFLFINWIRINTFTTVFLCTTSNNTRVTCSSALSGHPSSSFIINHPAIEVPPWKPPIDSNTGVRSMAASQALKKHWSGLLQQFNQLGNQSSGEPNSPGHTWTQLSTLELLAVTRWCDLMTLMRIP